MLKRAADIFSNDSDRGLGGLYMGKVIALSRSVVPKCTSRARLSHMVSCADVPASALDGGSCEILVGSWNLSRVHVVAACCASWLCAVLPLALRMPVRTFVGWEAIVCA